MHLTLKFTHEWSKTEINFLDLTLFKGKRFKNTQILDIQCFSKPCDTFQYLSTDSSLSNVCFSGMVKVEAIRFIRNSSSETKYEQKIRLLNLKLLTRGYKKLPCRYFVQKTQFLFRGCSKNEKRNYTSSLLHASLPSKK